MIFYAKTFGSKFTLNLNLNTVTNVVQVEKGMKINYFVHNKIKEVTIYGFTDVGDVIQNLSQQTSKFSNSVIKGFFYFFFLLFLIIIFYLLFYFFLFIILFFIFYFYFWFILFFFKLKGRMFLAF